MQAKKLLIWCNLHNLVKLILVFDVQVTKMVIELYKFCQMHTHEHAVYIDVLCVNLNPATLAMTKVGATVTIWMTITMTSMIVVTADGVTATAMVITIVTIIRAGTGAIDVPNDA